MARAQGFPSGELPGGHLSALRSLAMEQPLLQERALHMTTGRLAVARFVGKGQGLPRHGIRPRGKRKTQLYILQSLPGVGPERAQALLDAFGSIEGVLTASTEELVMINGIGTLTAKAIHWAVHEPSSEYDRSREDSDPCL